MLCATAWFAPLLSCPQVMHAFMSSGYACFAQRADASDVYFTPQGAQQGHYQPSVPDLLTNPRALRGAVSFVRLAQHEANGQLAKAAKAFNGISSLGIASMSNPAHTSAPAEAAATSGAAAADGSAQAAAAAAAAQGQGAPHATTGLTSAMSAADGQEDEAADSEDGSAYALDDDVTTDATTDDGWFS